MKKIATSLLLVLVFIGCQQGVTKTDITKLNGYWEIEKVVRPQGEDKVYGINESFDYFQVDTAGIGIRQKVMPQLNGRFLTNDTHEDVRVKWRQNKTYIDYKTGYAKWSEEIVKLTDTELVLKNDQDKEYHYKKTEKIDLLGDGKTNP
ncbi:hypothetical protein [Flavobacterium agrisoli]|uniref:Lipocalin-like protein n=1 Tax=Flavobacterium agrisoli TaxID=2793066 RepID=A0A934PNY8_9FLAO|nr:hypothetical protein [Flavobacterium agrisoli]MBK0369913.1 hypothetical protein [Flavobacterium agrisoli]